LGGDQFLVELCDLVRRLNEQISLTTVHRLSGVELWRLRQVPYLFWYSCGVVFMVPGWGWKWALSFLAGDLAHLLLSNKLVNRQIFYRFSANLLLELTKHLDGPFRPRLRQFLRWLRKLFQDDRRPRTGDNLPGGQLAIRFEWL